MDQLHHHFTWIDWTVVFGYLALTTWVGHLMRGKQGTIRDFFLGGRSLPWPAVSGSIIATEISGVSFIAVPGAVMALKGDFTYLQWAMGSILARVLIARYFVKVFHEKDIFSPYDYMGQKIGPGAKKLATVLFTVGSILAQSVRVLVASLPLQVVTPLPFGWCVAIIGLFAIGWTLMGGMRTVIWTDVMQFGLFVVGGLVALFWMVAGFADGWETLFSTARSVQMPDGEVIDKMRVLDFQWDLKMEFTFWVALFAVPFLNLNAFGVDQLNAQRMFCCRDARDAGKAIVWSSVGQLVTVLMLMVGAALFVFYRENPPTDPAVLEAFQWKDGAPGGSNSDFVFPVWIVTELPVALKGLILAGIFAAAISSLDSILAALSQTTLSLIRRTHEDGEGEGDGVGKSDASGENGSTDAGGGGTAGASESARRLVGLSRLLVCIWGVLLTGFTFVLYAVQQKTDVQILSLAFGMTSYTVGPLLGMFLLALIGRGKGSLPGLVAGAVVSFLLALFVRTDVWILFMRGDFAQPLAEFLAQLPTYELGEGPEPSVEPVISFAWMWPATTIITLVFGLVFTRKIRKES